MKPVEFGHNILNSEKIDKVNFKSYGNKTLKYNTIC